MLLFAAVALGGCASKGKELMPAPEIDHSPVAQLVFDQVPPERRRSAVDLLYITDSAPDTTVECVLSASLHDAGG
jgi:hypothetical protein